MQQSNNQELCYEKQCTTASTTVAPLQVNSSSKTTPDEAGHDDDDAARPGCAGGEELSPNNGLPIYSHDQKLHNLKC